jgi:hypothetical protein
MPLPRQAIAEQSAERGRACDVLEVDRSSVRYRSARPDDAELRRAMKEVAAERRRFRFRRIHIMLERQGIHMNQKKLRRLYREEGLQVRKRSSRALLRNTLPVKGRQEACIGHALPDGRARGHQHALEPGFRFRRIHGRAQVPRFGCRR